MNKLYAVAGFVAGTLVGTCRPSTSTAVPQNRMWQMVDSPRAGYECLSYMQGYGAHKKVTGVHCFPSSPKED